MKSLVPTIVGFTFLFATGCGIAVDGDGTGNGDGDGDGDGSPATGDGDGDGNGPGLGIIGGGNIVGGGSVTRPSPGDGDGDVYYGDGDGDYYGDGDIAIGPGPGIGYPGYTGGGVDLVNCEPSWGFNESNYCELQYECENGWLYTYCDTYSGQTQCGCDSPAGYLNIAFDEGLGSSACEEIFDYCSSATPFEDTEPVCEQNYVESSSDYCSAGMQCSREIELGDGITGSTSEWRDVWCDGYGDGWMCECYGGNLWTRIEFEGDQETPALCNDLLNICGSGDLEPTGPVECRPQSQWADRDYCDVSLECAHDATLDGQAVSVLNYQYAGCQRTEAGTWDCWCSASGATELTLEAETAWDACTQVSTSCAAQ